MPVIPLPLYQACIINNDRSWTFVQTSLFLAFGKPLVALIPPFLELSHPSVPLDVAVFVLVVAQMLLARPLHHGVNVPSILDTVGRDAGIYFAAIASSHFVVVVLFAIARVRSFTRVLEFCAC